MDTEQVLNQLLLIAGLLALPAPLLLAEARALQRVPRLSGQPRWRERLALVPRVASVGTVLLAGMALAMYLYYRLNPPEDLQAFLQGRQRAVRQNANSRPSRTISLGTNPARQGDATSLREVAPASVAGGVARCDPIPSLRRAPPPVSGASNRTGRIWA